MCSGKLHARIDETIGHNYVWTRNNQFVQVCDFYKIVPLIMKPWRPIETDVTNETDGKKSHGDSTIL